MVPAAKVKRNSGQRSGQISGKPLSLSRMPRTMRRKCVAGRTSPIARAHAGRESLFELTHAGTGGEPAGHQRFDHGFHVGVANLLAPIG